MRRIATALLLTATLLGATACTDGYGRTDYGRTALLGAGIGAGAALLVASANDRPHGPPPRYYGRPGGYYGGGYGGGGYYRGGYGRW